MPDEMSINRLLYAMLSQKCLKDIDWNKVALDPILAQEITNGHAARMRYSRFKKQMEDAISPPPRQLKTDTPRRGRVKKRKTLKRDYNTNSQKNISRDFPFCLKTEQDPTTPPPRSSTEVSGLRTPPPTLERIKIEPDTDPATPSSSSRLSTPLLLSAHSDFSPTSPSFPTPGVVSLNRSMDSSGPNRRTADQSIAPSQLHSPANKHREFPSEFIMEEWDGCVNRRVQRNVEWNADGDMVFVKSEEEEYASCGIFV